MRLRILLGFAFVATWLSQASAQNFAEDHLRAIHWDQVQDETVKLMQQYLRIDTSNPPGNEVAAAEFFHRLGAGAAVITMGGDGAVLISDRARLRAGVYPIEYVDGSGGGDAFDAGYIYGLLNNMDTEDCLRVASALGASCVRAVGTTPGVFTRRECEEFMRKHTLPIERL